MTRPILAKGVNFLYARRFIEQEYGKDMWDRVLRSLPQDVQEIWGEGILVNKEYPFTAFKATMSALSSVLGAAKERELTLIYEYIADQSLNKIYKIFFSLTNPSFVIKNYPKLWDKFFNTGKVEVPVAEKGHAVLRFTLPAIFLDWLPSACLGYSKKAVEMGRGRDVRLNQKSIERSHSGDEWEIVYELTWSE